MPTEARPDPETRALLAELDALYDAGPSPDATATLATLLARARALEAEGDPRAPFALAEVLFCTGALALTEADAATAFHEALPHADRAHRDAPDDIDRRDRLASLHYNLGNMDSSAERHADAEAAYRAALPLQEANVRDRPGVLALRNRVAQTHFNLGNTLVSMGRGVEAAEWFRTARDLWTALVAAAPEHANYAHDLARSHFNLAWIAGQPVPTPEALDAYPQAQAIWERLLERFGEHTERRCDVARCYYNHSLLLDRAGRADEALTQLERSLPHFEKLTAREPANTYFASLIRQARKEHARQLAPVPAKALAYTLREVARRAEAPRAAGDATALKALGLSLMDQARAFREGKRPVEMAGAYRAAIGLVAEAAALDPATDAGYLEAALWFDLNMDLRAFERYDAAERAVRTARHRWEALRARDPDDPRVRRGMAGVHNHLGIVYAETGRDRAAEASYRAALALREEGVRAQPDDHENQLYLGGALCNLGNVLRDRGYLDAARGYYERAVAAIEPMQSALAGNALVAPFLRNARDGLRQCAERVAVDPDRFASATVSWGMTGPAALAFDEADGGLRAELERVDALRLAAGDDGDSERASAALVERAPECAEAWLLRGLVLGHFRTQEGNAKIDWHDARHLEATAAFYEAEVRRAEWYEARLYRGLALVQAAEAAQAGRRALGAATEKFPEAERKAYLAPLQTREYWDRARARECLTDAVGLRPDDARAREALGNLGA